MGSDASDPSLGPKGEFILKKNVCFEEGTRIRN